jgi:hypothetical protein
VSAAEETNVGSGAETAPRPLISIPSQALGAIEVRAESLITVCEPLAGFPGCSSYALIEHVGR